MDTALIPDKKSFRPRELAGCIGVHVSTIYRWINEDNKLNAKKIAGHTLRISRSEVEKIIKDVNE